MFSYAIDRDAPLKSSTDNVITKQNYRVTNDLIKIMNPAPLSTVTLFEHCNFAGWSSSLIPGDYTLSQLRVKSVSNDQVSSIKVTTGYEVTVYEHDNFGGRSLTLTGNNGCLVDNYFNDNISSIKIVRK